MKVSLPLKSLVCLLMYDVDCRYVRKATPAVRQWLETLRSGHGVKLFILTNSAQDFASLMLDYSLGEDWAELFDLVIYRGGKPRFFDSPNPIPFSSLSGEEVTTPLHLGDHVNGGSLHGLLEFMSNHAGLAPTHRRTPVLDVKARAVGAVCCDCGSQAGEAVDATKVDPQDLSVVYLGDHLTGDVLAASRAAKNWHTIAVVEELLIHHSDIETETPCDGDGCELLKADREVAEFLNKSASRYLAIHYSISTPSMS
eukprot:m.118567 g.118567  ORF g.118567 m.118567 type:complete len:255 (+) comp13657_c0_seq12:1023-1787(+)